VRDVLFMGADCALCWLLFHGATCCEQAGNYFTALHMAALNGHTEAVKTLLALKADATAVGNVR